MHPYVECVIAALWLSCGALFLALLEIEIEGSSGWAERLPTFRPKAATLPRWARIACGFLFGKKPVTGYHLYLVAFVFILFHGPFAFGTEWTLAAEFRLLSRFILFWLVEDFLWFIMNPAYGISEFRRGRVWWHDLDGWAFEHIPRAFIMAFSASLSFALAADLFHGALQWIMIVWNALAFILLCVSLAPKYHAWLRRMRD